MREYKEFSGFSVHPTEVTATLIKYRVDIDLETALDIDLETALDQVNYSW